MATYVYVKRNTKRPYSYSDEDVDYIQFKYVPLSTAFNMIHSKQIGWERAKKGDYAHWIKLKKGQT
jgi:hypothetical protein|tara:strand:- start:1293 stop:1490 length:198 start_codon:yes stop_codon:yes gene_type:complete